MMTILFFRFGVADDELGDIQATITDVESKLLRGLAEAILVRASKQKQADQDI